MIVEIASILGIVGVFLNMTKHKEGFIVWSFTNALWLFYSEDVWAKAMWATYLVSSWIGYYYWRVKK